MKGQHSTIALTNVFDIEVIGSELLTYLGPKDLCSLKVVNRHVCSEVEKVLVALFKKYFKPLKFGEWDSNRVAVRKDGFTYSNRKDLLDFLFKMMGDLDFYGCHSETLSEARNELQCQSSWEAEFRSPRGVKPVSLIYKDVAGKKEAMLIVSRIIMSGFGFSGWRDINSDFVRKVRSMEDWLHCLISQRNASVGTWSWSCPHDAPCFDGGNQGNGVMISLSEGLKIEISAVDYESSSIKRRTTL